MSVIGIIDADLIGRSKHRFPNLACMKISAFWKQQNEKEGGHVNLITNYDTDLSAFDKVYISKVFTDTPVPQWIDDLKHLPPDEERKIQIGGTGFYFDQAPPLGPQIEHHMPDYNLYDEWIALKVEKGRTLAASKGKEFNESRFRVQFKEYTDYSIGFLTRGCFRKCKFCVNQKYDHVFLHSPLDEFYRADRKKICLLDDNVLGCPQWKELLEELQATKKPFKFKQGLDARVLTDEKCKILFKSKYDGDFTFAFDNIKDYDLIKSKLEMIRRHSDSNYIKFYVFVGYESAGAEDIENAFKRIELLMQYGCIPYLMRYESKYDKPWDRSVWRGMYITMARWCNQIHKFKTTSFREFCEECQHYKEKLFNSSKKIYAEMRYLNEFKSSYPEIAEKYFDKKYQPIKKSTNKNIPS